MDKKGQLEVEIIRARGLVVKPGSKTLPGKEEKSWHHAWSSTEKKRIQKNFPTSEALQFNFGDFFFSKLMCQQITILFTEIEKCTEMV